MSTATETENKQAELIAKIKSWEEEGVDEAEIQRRVDEIKEQNKSEEIDPEEKEKEEQTFYPGISKLDDNKNLSQQTDEVAPEDKGAKATPYSFLGVLS